MTKQEVAVELFACILLLSIFIWNLGRGFASAADVAVCVCARMYVCVCALTLSHSAQSVCHSCFLSYRPQNAVRPRAPLTH